ncbi:MAG TPA: hypothetical protein DCY48_04950 [Candidatus Magasanikbacteria bacterium]|nr:MAG: hypothetical protein A3I74_03430 [Candidatus Magasanikbacteria bacterium RIFCSPLOWO2_02_FULL_47_16]OGH80257.1 MAG: hypothetical protein A3C10_03710 [Candidatus Magasanikbacteria bacterium RIFCSPHIGHO2_02_FULL_48_18]OGH81993.1 MAG: hypothetical protein A3G08_00660 [Candidatus Magasanikbacteria bacterium RIFCSPLOWO2_12_FULL_47_9b]HAZ29087.1 hypothetical protein [Candidatus Magasanikbacteria bacterium]
MIFGRKKEKTIPDQHLASVVIHTIPDIFYGGKNPDIYAAPAKDATTIVSEKKKIVPPSAQKGGASSLFLFHFFRNKKVMMIGGGVLFCLIAVATTWYYIRDASGENPIASAQKKPAPIQTSQESVATSSPVQEALEESGVTTTTDEQIPPASPTSSASLITLIFPDFYFTGSDDVDDDGLTDIEEEIFGTDSGSWDTDGDGYYDGQEVYNLYNPKGLAPRKLIDSGLILEYINPQWQYRVYYPGTWGVGAVDPQASQVLFSDLSGDYIALYTIEKKAEESFSAWFGAHASDQLYSDLSSVVNRFEEDLFVRKDGMVAYAALEARVFIIIYHPAQTPNIFFRQVMQMMIQSFRPEQTSVEIPDQVLLDIPSA